MIRRLFKPMCVAFALWWVYTFSWALAQRDPAWFFVCIGILAVLQGACWWIVVQVERTPAQADHSAVPRTAQERRAAHMRANGGHHTAAQWRALCHEYGGRCACCGNAARLTKDHVLPVSMGGSNDISNLQPLCTPCNSRKGARHIDYRKGARHVSAA